MEPPAVPSTSPGIASQSGSQSSTASSGVSAGALTITSDAAQQALTGQDAATAAAARSLVRRLTDKLRISLC
jgi:hypothetical protein